MRALLLLLLPLPAMAGDVLVTWIPEDLPIDHTRIYYDRCESSYFRMGQAQGVMPEVTETVIPLPPGEWCFKVTHVLTDFTEVTVKQFCAGKKRPNPPENLLLASRCTIFAKQ